MFIWVIFIHFYAYNSKILWHICESNVVIIIVIVISLVVKILRVENIQWGKKHSGYIQSSVIVKAKLMWIATALIHWVGTDRHWNGKELLWRFYCHFPFVRQHFWISFGWIQCTLPLPSHGRDCRNWTAVCFRVVTVTSVFVGWSRMVGKLVNWYCFFVQRASKKKSEKSEGGTKTKRTSMMGYLRSIVVCCLRPPRW